MASESTRKRLLRRHVRVILLLATTAVCFGAIWTLHVLLKPTATRRLRWAVLNTVFRLWSRTCLRMMGGRLRVDGPRPRPPFVLVSNHLSYLDILAFAACIDAWFVAKREIRDWPLIGVLCASVGTIFIDRKSSRDAVRANAAIEDALDRGYGVVLFPEGTFTQGPAVRRFRSSLLDYPARRRMPVRAAAVSYRTPPGEPGAIQSICWSGDASLRSHVKRLLELPHFEVVVRFSPNAPSASDRKDLAVRLQQEVEGIMSPANGQPSGAAEFRRFASSPS